MIITINGTIDPAEEPEKSIEEMVREYRANQTRALNSASSVFRQLLNRKLVEDQKKEIFRQVLHPMKIYLAKHEV